MKEIQYLKTYLKILVLLPCFIGGCAERNDNWHLGGETMTEIARKYRTTSSAIAQVNNLKEDQKIQLGDKLIIPVTPARSGRGELVANSSRIRYIVRRGDTVASIARDSDVSTSQLRQWNKLRVSSKLRPGRILVLYTAAAGAPSVVAKARKSVEPVSGTSNIRRVRVVHRVKKGDTLYTIASNYGTTIDLIRDWNRLSHNDSLKIGERLTLYLSR